MTGSLSIHTARNARGATVAKRSSDPAVSVTFVTFVWKLWLSLNRSRMPQSALAPEFYARPTLVVSRALIGKVLVHDTPAGRASGVIVETEAYIGESDPACHAAPGPTARNAPLYGPPGVAYVYLNYGIHYLVNAVTEPEGSPAAVLIRALEPLEGAALMRRRRMRSGGRRAALIPEHDLCRGPGNLTAALGITLKHNGRSLTSGSLRVEDRGLPERPVEWSRRIGIRIGVEQEWRCSVVGSPAVSGRRLPARASLRLSRNLEPR